MVWINLYYSYALYVLDMLHILCIGKNILKYVIKDFLIWFSLLMIMFFVRPQADLVRSMKEGGAAKGEWQPHVKVLLEMKKQLESMKKATPQVTLPADLNLWSHAVIAKQGLVLMEVFYGINKSSNGSTRFVCYKVLCETFYLYYIKHFFVRKLFFVICQWCLDVCKRYLVPFYFQEASRQSGDCKNPRLVMAKISTVIWNQIFSVQLTGLFLHKDPGWFIVKSYLHISGYFIALSSEQP